MGPERRSHVMEEKVKLATAYHEVLAQQDQQLSLSFFREGMHSLRSIPRGRCHYTK